MKANATKWRQLLHQKIHAQVFGKELNQYENFFLDKQLVLDYKGNVQKLKYQTLVLTKRYKALLAYGIILRLIHNIWSPS